MEGKEKGKKSVSAILTETIISSLEDKDKNGFLNPFWLETPEKAVNAKSGRQYRGINKFILSPLVRKYKDNRFLTFNEVTQMGGSVKKDEKGHIVHFSTLKKDNSNNTNKDISSLREQCQSCKHSSSGKDCICQKEEKQQWQAEQAQLPEDEQNLCSDYESKDTGLVNKYYRVWNVQQTDLIEKGLLPSTDGRTQTVLNEEAAKAILMGLELKGLRIKATTSKPGYDISTNTVMLAGLPFFKEKGTYYASMMKQLAFAVGAGEKFLNLGYMKAEKDGSNPQENIVSYGNLVAEMAASIIAGELGINYRIKRDIEYIIPLIQKMQKDSHFIIMASNSANRIAQYLLNIGAEYQEKNKNNKVA